MERACLLWYARDTAQFIFRGMPKGTYLQCGEFDIYYEGNCLDCYRHMQEERLRLEQSGKSCSKCKTKISLSETRCKACWNKRRDKKIKRLEKEVTELKELVLRLSAPKLQFELIDPWFELARNGAKRYVSSFKRGAPEIGDTVLVRHFTDRSRPSFAAIVLDIATFPTIEVALRTLPLEAVLPGVTTVEEGVAIYSEAVSLEDQEREGVAMIKLSPVYLLPSLEAVDCPED